MARKNIPDTEISETTAPAVNRTTTRNRTIKRSTTSNAADAIGPITQDAELFCLTNGQFSIIDILAHCLEYTGPAALDIATWTAADSDLRRAHAFFMSGKVTDCRLLVDPSFKVRQPGFCRTLLELFGENALRTTPLHGKFATIRNDKWDIAIRTSMNLNTNKRIETVEISCDSALTAVLADFVDSCFEREPAFNFSRTTGQNAGHEIKSGLAF